MWILIVVILIVAGVFNPWTGLFGNTYYSPKRKEKRAEKEPLHRTFRLTKGC